MKYNAIFCLQESLEFLKHVDFQVSLLGRLDVLIPKFFTISRQIVQNSSMEAAQCSLYDVTGNNFFKLPCVFNFKL